MRPLRTVPRWLIVPTLALILTLAGCGASATVHTPAASPTATATSTPAPTATATPPWTSPPNCGDSTTFGHAPRLAGTNFIIAGPALALGLLLGTSQALPYDSVDVNPSIESNGYLFYLCNGSQSTPHTISSVSVRIDTLTPFSGRLLEWPACRSAYSRSFPGGSGCGGGFASDEGLQASFPAGAAQGAAVTAAQIGTSQTNSTSPGSPPYGPLPVQIAPGRAIALIVGIKLLNPSGTYTFAVGISLDGAAPAYSQPTRPVLLAPVAQTWTGPACEAPAMQSQIPPATNPPTYYICPAS
jgi:hypothetical protein